MRALHIFLFWRPCRIVFFVEFYHTWNFWIVHCAWSEECFLTLPRRSASLRELGGVLHRTALEESFSAQPLRSASTTHLGGVHHLAELVDYVRVWFLFLYNVISLHGAGFPNPRDHNQYNCCQGFLYEVGIDCAFFLMKWL